MSKIKITDPQDELLTLVDRNNKVIGSIPRKKAHETPGIFYRTIYVLVFNKDNQVLLQKRSPTKDLYPDCWDISVGGHVNFGDGYIETATREIKEELGLIVKESDLEFKGEVLVRLPKSNEFFSVYEYYLKPDEKINISEEEISSTRWMSIDGIKRSMKNKSLKWYERPLQTIKALY